MTVSMYSQRENKEKIGFDVVLLGLYFFTLPLDFVPLFGGSVAKLVAILPVAYMFLFRLKNLRVHMHIAIVMILYVLLNRFSESYALNYYYANERTRALLLNFGLVIICSSFDRNKREIGFLKKAIVMSGWLAVALIIIYGDKMSGLRLIIKINGMYQDPNYFCGYLIFTILYYLENLLRHRRRCFSIISLAIFFTIVFLTGSRGGFLAVVSACLIFILAQKTNKAILNRLVALLLVAVVLLFAATTFLPEEIKERYSLEFTKEDGGANRLAIWESLNKDYKNSNEFNKLFGKGAGNVRFYTYNGNVGHNLWIETRCELGLIGLLMLIVIIYIYMKKTRKIEEKIFFATLMGYIVMTMTLSLCVYKPIYSMFIMSSVIYDYERKLKIVEKETSNE